MCESNLLANDSRRPVTFNNKYFVCDLRTYLLIVEFGKRVAINVLFDENLFVISIVTL